jgi:6-phosphogluconolactonase
MRIVACLLLAFSIVAQSLAEDTPEKMLVYIGTYTGPKSKGIYLYELTMKDGSLRPLGLAAETASPSFLAIHPNKKFLYAVGEVANFQGKSAGAVSAFAIQEDGKLRPLNSQTSGGGGPCHLSVDSTGQNVLLANYGGGSVEVVPIAPDGSLKTPSAFIQHHGSSADKSRQGEPHAHSINLDKSNKFAVAADLGTDELFVYRFDAAKGSLNPNQPPSTKLKPASGPRHFAFHPSNRYAYAINELNCTLSAMQFDAVQGTLTEIQNISTLGATPFQRGFSTAEVQVHPTGRFVYGSNRGHDSIVGFRVNEADGKLTYLENESTQGKTPRNFGIDPTGQYLIAANQGSDSLVVFRIHPASGDLHPTGIKVEAPTPVCVKFLVR